MEPPEQDSRSERDKKRTLLLQRSEQLRMRLAEAIEAHHRLKKNDDTQPYPDKEP